VLYAPTAPSRIISASASRYRPPPSKR
jgi:hypothetical protein